ncbi:MAG: pyridoxal-phosphate dependent enzyme [Chloroflexota bacterium]|nr:pyridoxal-phosphate dependent enzyme [Chloroflexota bacterium]
MMSYLTGLRCIRCGTLYPVERRFEGCDRCAFPRQSNVTPVYDYAAIQGAVSRRLVESRPPTMWRYCEFFGPDEENIVTLGEGFTPLLHARDLGKRLGIPKLYLKNDTVNPTWSFKDRLASSSISMAKQMEAPLIAVTSSGNAGSAAAAFAAKAGIPAVIFTTSKFPLSMRTQMQAYGARLISMPTPPDRWTMVGRLVREYGAWPTANYADPPVGSNPYGVDGYKSIGFEICEQLGWRAPDKMVVPVGHGDAFYGAWKAFNEFRDVGLVENLPQMVAAEVFGPLANALTKGLDYVEEMPGGPTVAISVGTTQSVYQALRPLLDSNGLAGTASNEEMLEMQIALASEEGILAETSSVLTLAYARKLREVGKIDEDETVVCLLTSSGLKDPETLRQSLPEIPAIEPDMDQLVRALRETYNFTLPRKAAAA